MTENRVVIIGAGHSGTKAAAALRKHGWAGHITLIGQEHCLPYDRPPLSKAVLLGSKTVEDCSFFSPDWFEAQQIELLTGCNVESINRSEDEVLLSDGSRLQYDHLVLATGSRPNELNVSGVELDGVWPLREPHHAKGLIAALQPGRCLVVIGAGVIGLEVAAAAVEIGCKVHVLETAPHAMGRSLPAEFAGYLIAEHRDRGVDFTFSARVKELLGTSRVEGVVLDSGETLMCDTVVYGVGALPRDQLADSAGLLVDGGICTDQTLLTADRKIRACGDVCRFPSKRFNQMLRLENWKNAEQQAVVVAMGILGKPVEYDPIPWFWSNQYNWGLQVAGLPGLATQIEYLNYGGSRFFFALDEAGVLQGAGALGSVREIAQPMRKLMKAIEDSATFNAHELPSSLQALIG